MYTEDTILTRGAYKNKRLRDIPREYFKNLYVNKSYFCVELKEYVENNLDMLGITAQTRPVLSPPTCPLEPFGSEAEVRREFKRRRNKKTFDEGTPTGVFECKECSFWHLSFDPQKRFTEEKQGCPCGKISFDTEGSAKNELSRIRSIRNMRRSIPTRAYKCEFSNKWHLTSQPKPDFGSAKKKMKKKNEFKYRK